MAQIQNKLVTLNSQTPLRNSQTPLRPTQHQLMSDILSLLSNNLPFTPNEEQYRVLAVLVRFVETPVSGAALILRGYAGTGKTSLVSALVRSLKQHGTEPVLLAPTGRAAKVFAHYSGEKAYTIHKIIYRQKTFDGEDTKFSLNYNKRKNAIFIVDEASMIANEESNSLFGSGRLLDDLVKYVYSGTNCKLLLVGDTAQLPPVGEAESPALSVDMLTSYGLKAAMVELRTVMRQGKDTGVLSNATMLRNIIAQGEPQDFPVITQKGFNDLYYLPGGEFIEELEGCYSDAGSDETIIVTRSNKRAIEYNMGVRARIYEREQQITAGDRIMVAKNNYFWTEQAAATSSRREAAEVDFIANGDIAEVAHLSNFHEMGGFHFADATLLFPDYNNMELEARLLLDTLTSESPALTRDESLRLYNAALDKYARYASRRTKLKKLRQDPHYNAMQIKYAYAVTCHKAQGGQWRRVFLDQGFTPPDMLSSNYLRWLYTAFTRTTEKLYLINWPMSQRAEKDDWDF